MKPCRTAKGRFKSCSSRTGRAARTPRPPEGFASWSQFAATVSEAHHGAATNAQATAGRGGHSRDHAAALEREWVARFARAHGVAARSVTSAVRWNRETGLIWRYLSQSGGARTGLAAEGKSARRWTVGHD